MVISPGAAVRGARSRHRAAACTVAAAALTLVAATLPPPEPAGVGDRLFPHLGNPGYDVQSYDIALRYSGNNSRPLEARTDIRAQVTSAAGLERFNLDFAGGTVRSVEVNGRPAEYARTGEDLAVTPATRLQTGQPLRVRVRHTSEPGRNGTGGWLRTKDGLVMANQPDGAHRVFPANDHPSDKARFTFRVTAPRKFTVVGGGVPAGRQPHGGDVTWTYRQLHPAATELAQVSIGRSEVLRRTGPHGLPVRDVVPHGTRRALEPLLKQTPQQIAWLERRLGSYPFENYGLLVADANTGFELETQTLSLFERELLAARDYPGWYQKSLMVHELSHQWFGNSVSPHRWTDLWLSEGHATWYEWRYAEHGGGPKTATRARHAYEQSNDWRSQFGPPARPRGGQGGGQLDIFSSTVYDGSALVLYALRQKIGPEAFAQLERAWVAEHRDGNVTTRDFTTLASQVSGQDLSGFLHGWLYGRKTPPMPGHPNWRAR